MHADASSGRSISGEDWCSLTDGARERRGRFEAIVSSSGDAILSGSLDGTIETWNSAAERLYGYRAAEMIGSSIERLRPDGTAEGLVRERWALATGKPMSLETRRRRKDGSLVDVAVTLSPLRDDHGEVVGVVSVGRDVTDRNRSAARLREANSRFARAFEAASTGMALVAPDGRFLSVNPALCTFLARDRAALLATSFPELTHPDDVEQSVTQLRRALAGEIDSYQQSKRYLLPDGGIVWGLMTFTIARDPRGAVQHFITQIEDITGRKTAENELQRYAAHLQALSEHDPLTGLLNQRAFEGALEEELRVLRAGGHRFTVLLVEVADEESTIAAAGSLTRTSRSGDLTARLNDRELAVLLPNVDADSAAPIIQRIQNALAASGGIRCSHLTARSGENAHALLRRIRARLAPGCDVGRASPSPPDSITRLLELAQRQLGMPVALLSRIAGDSYVFEHVVGDHERFGITRGDALPLGETHCQRMLDGRIGSTVTDLAAEPETRELEITRRPGLRAYAGVPVRLRSGEIYGTICAVDDHPHPELDQRQVELLGFVADLAAELIEQATARRVETSATGVRTLLIALEARDLYTGEHSKQVVALASAVARRLGLAEHTIRDIEQVALLHDIGKVGIPDAILQKQGPLDEQEWQLMRQHPIVGERIIAGTSGLAHLSKAMRSEHERWDGTGYPDGLAGEQIPIASRITLACDALQAMTSDRPYRPAMTLARAEQQLRSCSGSQFDPLVITALRAEIATPSGSQPLTGTDTDPPPPHQLVSPGHTA